MAAPATQPTALHPFVPPKGTPSNYSPPGHPAPIDQYNYSPGADGAYTVDPPGSQAPHDQHQVNSPTPLTLDQLAQAIAEIGKIVNAARDNNSNAAGAPPDANAAPPAPPDAGPPAAP